MAISVSVPKEITEYKSKIFFGLNGRQLAYLLLAALLAVGLGALCYLGLHISMEITGYIIIGAALPFVGLGFVRPHDMPLEKYLTLLGRHYFGKNLLPYQSELLLDAYRVQKQLDPNERSKSTHGKPQKSAHRFRTKGNQEALQSVSGRAQGFAGNRRQRKEKIQSAKEKIKGARRESKALRRQAAKGKIKSGT